MTDQTKDCKECFGTGNEARMQSPHPVRPPSRPEAVRRLVELGLKAKAK